MFITVPFCISSFFIHALCAFLPLFTSISFYYPLLLHFLHYLLLSAFPFPHASFLHVLLFRFPSFISTLSLSFLCSLFLPGVLSLPLLGYPISASPPVFLSSILTRPPFVSLSLVFPSPFIRLPSFRLSSSAFHFLTPSYLQYRLIFPRPG